MLTDLRLRDFRCFSDLQIRFGSARTFVIGPNAVGKTSLLEAACVALRMQSPRAITLSDVIQIGCPSLSVEGHFSDTHFQLSYGANGRQIWLDSKLQTGTSDYLDMARVAWFGNADRDLVQGSGSVRRRYLDFLGSQSLPGYRSTLRCYDRALRSRNSLLKERRPRREVAAFDEPLVQAGELLHTMRRALLDVLGPLATAACAEISGNSDALSTTYAPGCIGVLREALLASRAEEERLRLTTVGPHRDDVLLKLNNKEAGTFASEGQQRSIALALKLAQARHLHAVQGRAPVLLLDDIFGELDIARRNRLLASLPSNAQIIITTTTFDWAQKADTDVVISLPLAAG